jgi:hypothetical protein
MKILIEIETEDSDDLDTLRRCASGDIRNESQLAGIVPGILFRAKVKTIHSEKYIYRNLPFSAVTTKHDGKQGQWNVSGFDKQGKAGVLEWAFDKADAERIVKKMKKDVGRFRELRVNFDEWS